MIEFTFDALLSMREVLLQLTGSCCRVAPAQCHNCALAGMKPCRTWCINRTKH